MFQSSLQPTLFFTQFLGESMTSNGESVYLLTFGAVKGGRWLKRLGLLREISSEGWELLPIPLFPPFPPGPPPLKREEFLAFEVDLKKGQITKERKYELKRKKISKLFEYPVLELTLST